MGAHAESQESDLSSSGNGKLPWPLPPQASKTSISIGMTELYNILTPAVAGVIDVVGSEQACNPSRLHDLSKFYITVAVFKHNHPWHQHVTATTVEVVRDMRELVLVCVHVGILQV